MKDKKNSNGLEEKREQVYNLETFCYKVREAVEEYYSDEKEIKVQTVKKNNGVVLMGITIMEKGMNVAPTIYLNEAFALYNRERDGFGEIVMKVIGIYEKNKLERDIDVNFFKCYEQVKNKFTLRLINYEMNKELLKEVPYEKFHDLALICYCSVIREDIGNGAILIKNEHLRLWEIEKEELFRIAKENMPKLFPAEIKNMLDIVGEMMKKEDVEYVKSELDENHSMYVLTNKERLFGATTLAYPGMLQKIGAQWEKDFYILPSSVHEVILVPVSDDTEGCELSEMVYEINSTQVSREEVLANHAYLYHYKSDELEILPLLSKD